MLSTANGRIQPEQQVPAPLSDAITTDNSFSVEDLVKDIFVNGACNTINNISSIGDERGIGYFEGGGSSISVERGILLSTGPISNAEGPNEATDESGNFNDDSGDPDLELLAQGEVLDAVGISFDFTPLDSLVTFRYAFASEEYCEFVGSEYNDVFGFFISGPGISGGFSSGADNVALIPGSEDFVSINSVNHLNNTGYYRHNELPDDADFCGLDISEGGFLPQVEYDGFTKRLTAVLKLQACETYQIRLVVADVGDNFFDSAVFLEAESFNLGGKVQLTQASSPQEPAEEGCPGASFRFSRLPGSSNAAPLSVNLELAESSTAQPGIDFAPLPSSISIPAGSDAIELPVEVFNDGLAEPLEQLTLKLDIPCACYSDSATLYIADSPELTLQLPDLPICEGGNNTFQPELQGGRPGYTYLWSDGSETPTLSVNQDGPQTYWLSVTDACSNAAVDTAQLIVTEAPTASLSDTAARCAGDTAYFPLELTGVPPWQIAYEWNGNPQPALTLSDTSNPSLPAYRAGTYTLTGVSDASCEGSAQGSARLELRAIAIAGNPTHPACAGSADGELQIELSGGTPPYQHRWADAPNAALNREQLPAGDYRLVVEDANGCRQAANFTLQAPPPLLPVQPDCADLQSGELKLWASGGTPPYSYALNGSSLFETALPDTLTPGQWYDLTIQDANGCELQQDFLMPAAYEQLLELPASLGLKLGQAFTLSPQLNIPQALLDQVRWSPAAGLSCTDCLSPTVQLYEAKEYTLEATDLFGCTSVFEIRIQVDDEIDLYIPSAFSPNGDQHNDYFTVYANTFQVERVADFKVFDRWGGLLFQQQNFPPNSERIGWDGTSNGYELDPGLYAYYVEVVLRSGERKALSGAVQLIR